MSRPLIPSRALTRESTFAILVGMSCPLRCAHCAVKSPQKTTLTGKEITLLRDTVRAHAPKEILFSGGEPTLYIDNINRITSAHSEKNNLSVRITTSGYFAKDVESAKKLITSIKFLNHVQMSYDKFHQEFVPFEYLKNLNSACSEVGVEFSVVMAIQSALDLAFAAKIKTAGDFVIGTLKVTETGEAKKNSLAFNYPCFDRNVWRSACPSRGRISYICGKGFSLCCSSLAFSHGWRNFVHPTAKTHLNSQFYSLISSCSFGQIKKMFNLRELDLKPKHTHRCTLCGYLFSEIMRKYGQENLYKKVVL